MFQPLTYETALLLAKGVSATQLARVEGVTVGAIHLRRRRFDQYAGGVTPRVGKRGRPRKDIYGTRQRTFPGWCD